MHPLVRMPVWVLHVCLSLWVALGCDSHVLCRLQSSRRTRALPCAHVRAGEHSHGCVKPSSSEWCVLCELEKLAATAYGAGSGTRVLNPRPLVRGEEWRGRGHGRVGGLARACCLSVAPLVGAQ